MGKVDDNKKLKMNTLLQTAFDLFTGKGFAKTTVSDIVNQAGLAKGTFYLYFKDKYDLRELSIYIEMIFQCHEVLLPYRSHLSQTQGSLPDF